MSGPHAGGGTWFPRAALRGHDPEGGPPGPRLLLVRWVNAVHDLDDRAARRACRALLREHGIRVSLATRRGGGES